MENKTEITQKENIKLSTGPVVRAAKAEALVISIENTTSNSITIDIYINNLARYGRYSKYILAKLSPHSKKIFNLQKPHLVYQIIFDNVVDGVYFWTATKTCHKNTPLNPSRYIAANTFTHADLININSNPTEFSTKFFTGPVVRDYESQSLVAVIENTTSKHKSIDLFINDLTPDGNESIFKKVNLNPHSIKIIKLCKPSLIYEVIFDQAINGVYFWLAARYENINAPLNYSSFIAANTFCHTKLIGGSSK